MGEKEKEKRKSVMDGNIFVTISFVHQNQREVLFHIAISVNGSPTEVHKAQGQMKEILTQSSLESRETLSCFKHLVFYSSSGPTVRT